MCERNKNSSPTAHSNNPSPTPARPLTRDQAFEILKSRLSLENVKRVAIYAAKNMLLPGDTVVSQRGTRFVTSDSSWFFVAEYDYLLYPPPRINSYNWINVRDSSIRTQFSSPPKIMGELDTLHYPYHAQNKSLPVLTFPDSDSLFVNSCIDFRIYVLNEAHDAILIIQGDTAKLNLSTEYKNFDINPENPDLKISIAFYYFLPDGYPPSYLFRIHCYYMPRSTYPPKVWDAVSGSVKLSLKPYGDYYYISAELKDVRFREQNGGKEIGLNRLIIPKTLCGWYPE